MLVCSLSLRVSLCVGLCRLGGWWLEFECWCLQVGSRLVCAGSQWLESECGFCRLWVGLCRLSLAVFLGG